MVFVRNVEVGTLRVNAGTGGALNNETDLLREIRESLRAGAGEPNVVQAIQIENRRVVQAIENLARQMAGVPGAGAPPIGGGGGGRGGTPEDQERFSGAVKALTAGINKLELALTTFEGGGSHDRERESYFQREVLLSTNASVGNLFKQLEAGTLTLSGTLTTFNGLVQNQFRNSVESLMASLIGAGLHATNFGNTFRALHHELVGVKESGVFGSNMLTPMQFFLEGITRVREGILTTSDSFRTVLSLVSDSLKNNLMSPLFMTGRSAAELAVDLHQARNDLRERFQTDTRASMSTKETNAALSALVEQQAKFGISAQFRDTETLSMMAQDQAYLRIISSMTGQTVGKLQEQLQASRAQQDVLVGLGRLNEEELRNFTRAGEYMKNLPGGKEMFDRMAQLLAYGKNPAEVMAQNPEYAKRAMVPGLIESDFHLLQTMMNRSSTDQLREALSQFGSRGVGGILQGMEPIMQGALGAQARESAQNVVTGNAAIGRAGQDAAQKAAAQESPFMRMLQHLTEIYQENIAPFMRLEVLIGAQTVALAFNTAALWSLSGRMGLGGLGGLIGGATRVIGPLAGAAIGAGGAYAAGASNTGILGAGAGSLIGGALGSMIGPLGTLMGTTAGGIIGGYLGQYLGQQNNATQQAETGIGDYLRQFLGGQNNATQQTQVSIGDYLRQYLGGQTAAIQQAEMAGPEAIATSTESSNNLMGQLISVNNDGNAYLSQMLGELQRQSGYLANADTSSPAATPAAGMGTSSNQQPRAMGRPDGSTPAN